MGNFQERKPLSESELAKAIKASKVYILFRQNKNGECYMDSSNVPEGMKMIAIWLDQDRSAWELLKKIIEDEDNPLSPN
jgi:hypothetical protein